MLAFALNLSALQETKCAIRGGGDLLHLGPGDIYERGAQSSPDYLFKDQPLGGKNYQMVRRIHSDKQNRQDAHQQEEHGQKDRTPEARYRRQNEKQDNQPEQYPELDPKESVSFNVL